MSATKVPSDKCFWISPQLAQVFRENKCEGYVQDYLNDISQNPEQLSDHYKAQKSLYEVKSSNIVPNQRGLFAAQDLKEGTVIPLQFVTYMNDSHSLGQLPWNNISIDESKLKSRMDLYRENSRESSLHCNARDKITSWNSFKQIMTTVVMKPVKPGQEITRSYGLIDWLYKDIRVLLNSTISEIFPMHKLTTPITSTVLEALEKARQKAIKLLASLLEAELVKCNSREEIISLYLFVRTELGYDQKSNK